MAKNSIDHKKQQVEKVGRAMLKDKEKIPVRSIHGGIDWLTMTSNDEAIGAGWYDLFRKWAKVQQGSNSYIRDWKNAWYLGAQTEGLKWGYSEKNKGYIMIASGTSANELWIDAMRKEISQSAARLRITRMDLQTTIRLNEPKRLAKEGFEMLRPGRNKVRKYAYVENQSQGETLYVGSRQSRFYGRLYDKGQQLGGQSGRLWRYEVEVKDPEQNRSAIEALSSIASGETDREREIMRFVYHWFAMRGVKPVYNYMGDPIVKEIGARVITTREKKLQWLRTQVRPTVAHLMTFDERNEVLEALGLEYLCWENRKSAKVEF